MFKKTLKDILRPLWHQKLNLQIKYDCYNKKNQNNLIKLNGKHLNERCFIIGNGPSLNVRDLELLKSEVTFAANRIYVLYDKTEWRPTYYFCQDPTVIRANIEEIKQNVKGIKLIKPIGYNKFKDKEAICFNIDYSDYNNNREPRFGEEIPKYVFDGYTVTYSMIQFAAYMGFKEIYLLGVDFNYSSDNTKIEESSYADKRMYDANKIGANPNLEYNLRAFTSARNYLKEHNIKIYNTTRGGKLEVFERKDFDKVIRGNLDDNK